MTQACCFDNTAWVSVCLQCSAIKIATLIKDNSVIYSAHKYLCDSYGGRGAVR